MSAFVQTNDSDKGEILKNELKKWDANFIGRALKYKTLFIKVNLGGTTQPVTASMYSDGDVHLEADDFFIKRFPKLREFCEDVNVLNLCKEYICNVY
jgi:hypothetical protein